MEPVSYVTYRVDGGLGCWTAIEWRPAHLRGIVERLWHFTGRTAHPRERVLPSGLLPLVVHLDRRYALVRDGRVELCPALVMSGAVMTGAARQAGDKPLAQTAMLDVEAYKAINANAAFARLIAKRK